VRWSLSLTNPKEVEEYITNFCTEYNITRKDKEGNILPSLGTGVVTYLKSQIAGENPGDILAKPSKVLSDGLSRKEVLDIVDEYFTSQLPSELLSVGIKNPGKENADTLIAFAATLGQSYGWDGKKQRLYPV
jgi:hypothetical protein